MFKLSNRSKSNRLGIKDSLIRVGDRAIQLTSVDFGYPSDAGMRTAKRQQEIFPGATVCIAAKMSGGAAADCQATSTWQEDL